MCYQIYNLNNKVSIIEFHIEVGMSINWHWHTLQIIIIEYKQHNILWSLSSSIQRILWFRYDSLYSKCVSVFDHKYDSLLHDVKVRNIISEIENIEQIITLRKLNFNNFFILGTLETVQNVLGTEMYFQTRYLMMFHEQLIFPFNRKRSTRIFWTKFRMACNYAGSRKLNM